MKFTVGSHNTGDERGRPTLFAGVIFFEEAIPSNILGVVARAARHGAARAVGYRVRVCKEQPDLVVLVQRRLFTLDRHRYTQVVKGVRKVSPNRGTYLIEGKAIDGRKVVFLAAHRINAAFPPFIRGEPEFRRDAWTRHAAVDRRLVAQYEARGFTVIAGGDFNTPHGESAFHGQLREVGDHFDRVAVSDSAHITHPEVLNREGSDHPRLRATVSW